MMKKTIFLRGLVLIASLAVAALPANAFDSCRAVDFNGDGILNLADVDIFASAFGTADPRVDLDGSGLVDEEDQPFFVAFFGQPCTGCMANLVDTGGAPTVDAADRDALVAAYGTDCRGDLNRDGTVDQAGDVDLLRFYIGPAPAGSLEARADFNDDGMVNLNDISIFVPMIGTDCSADLNTDGAIDTNDLWVLLASWGPCP